MVRWNALALLALLTSLCLPFPAGAQPPATTDTTAVPVAPTEAATPEAGAKGPSARSEAAPTPDARADGSDLLFRMGATAEVDAGKRVGQVITLGCDARVDGVVSDDLLVIGGDASVTGEVTGNVTIVGGRLDLGPGARVGNVTLVQSELTLVPGAAISGQVTKSSGPVWGWGVGWFFWLSVSAFVVACGLLFAAVGGRQLASAASMLSARPGGAGVAALALWIGLPALGTLALFSVVGIPIGVALLLFALPVLWFLGYLVAGVGVGVLIVGWRGAPRPVDHPYAAAALGLLVLQLVSFIPWIGTLLALAAGLWGAGALVLRSVRMMQGRPPEAAAAT
ncbi:polymer-forming cytoskeletal protein [Chondromyces apiculatus]|uniref:Polymer-forming cytoskeletal protein n=1 Tax=Chondromyces apiculatus DSM 436 TaxID=1192034 RepID=A0A017TDI8_9BACT|nr:polymer-forming cytoskeletal protein [Chondromyces apiculatus]EYF06977.1 Hypothetical protein CAP_1236 [Chondromyces apiculatus DSM 436]